MGETESGPEDKERVLFPLPRNCKRNGYEGKAGMLELGKPGQGQNQMYITKGPTPASVQ